ncbi:hypothetical protein BJ166DRAFT_229641 [Pestalotiopsis sp. NC0098]|nr:hypothetical protein BJ166DRAFT_229641 [Pestalotiopsis sp. NC0098]
MQRVADSGDPVSENNDSAESVEQNSPRQFVVPGASIRRRSPSAGGLTRIKSLLKHRDSMTEMVKEYDESENGPPLWQRISPWHRRLGILARQEEPIATEENGNRTSYWMRAQDHLARTDTIRTPKTFSSFRSPSPLRRAFSFMRNPSIPRERRHQPAYMSQGVPELPENCLLEMMDTSPRVELQDTEVVPPRTINRPCRLARPRLVAPSISTHYSYNEHEIAELPASEIQTPPLEDDNYPQQAKNDGPKPATGIAGYCRPGYAPRYDAGMSLGSSLLPRDDIKKVQTGRGDVPPLTLNPDPKSILVKGQCLDSPSKCPFPGCYLPSTRAQVDATTRPLSSCVQVPRPEPAMWASDQLSTFKKNDIRIVEVSNQDSGCKPGLSQGTDFEIKGLSHRDAMAMRNRGRLFTRTMQNLRRQGRDQKPEKPDRISANCARLQCSFNGEDEETDIPVGSKVHQIRMPFKIPSPTAVLRRYTNEQAKTPESLKSVSIDIDIGRHRERYSPWIIAGPVELDSRPIEATLYPRI